MIHTPIGTKEKYNRTQFIATTGTFLQAADVPENNVNPLEVA